MKHVLSAIFRLVMGGVLLGISVYCAFLMLCYYGEPFALLPATGVFVCFFLSFLCFHD